MEPVLFGSISIGTGLIREGLPWIFRLPLRKYKSLIMGSDICAGHVPALKVMNDFPSGKDEGWIGINDDFTSRILTLFYKKK